MLLFGSLHSAGKGGLDFEEEVVIVSEAVGGAFDDFDPIVDAFDDAGMQRPAGVSEDAVKIGFEPFGKDLQRSDAAVHGTLIPTLPGASGVASVAIGPELLEIVSEDADGHQRLVGGQQFVEL